VRSLWRQGGQAGHPVTARASMKRFAFALMTVAAFLLFALVIVSL